MIDRDENLIPLKDVPKHLPPPLRHTHVATVTRWCLRGVGHPRVRLVTVKVGGRRYVRPAALTEFIEALSATPGPVGPSVTGVPSAARAKAMRQAERDLDAAGI